ncbi:ACP S-malonyltransferase [Ruminiclostridium josui]|uniref:ACP S-malonyltransferase n=1 Tax=Ruminiclostridium josui TaxID=1499 RepID=UPI000ADFBC07
MIKTAILFPGQGSQYVGMGSDLYQRSSIARQTFEEANDVLGFDIKRLCFEGNKDELTETQNAQPAILTVSIAAFRTYMQEIGLEPSCLAGHSLGEISALVASDAISFSDGLKLVRKEEN